MKDGRLSKGQKVGMGLVATPFCGVFLVVSATGVKLQPGTFDYVLVMFAYWMIVTGVITLPLGIALLILTKHRYSNDGARPAINVEISERSRQDDPKP